MTTAWGGRALLDGDASRFPRPDGTLCHADFKGSNILVQVEGDDVRVVALLDWEFAFAGHPLFDFTMLLRFADRRAPELEQGVIDAYRAGGRTLPSTWKQTVKLLDLGNCVDMLRWAGPVMRRHLLGVIDRTLALAQRTRQPTLI